MSVLAYRRMGDGEWKMRISFEAVVRLFISPVDGGEKIGFFFSD
jgi:hypothetical protein